MKTQVIYAANKNKDADFDLQAGDFGRKRKKSPACRSKSEESGRKNRKKAEEITPGGNLNLQSLKDHCVFTAAPSDTSEIALRKNVVNYVYKAYYTALDLDHWVSLFTTMPPGEASISNETEAYQFSFHGHMMMIVLLLFLQKQNLALAVYLFGSVLSLPD